MSIAILPLATWAAGTNQNSIPANDNALRVEAMSKRVISKTTIAQPASPAEGDVYIIPVGRTGAQWSLFIAGDLTIFRGGTWIAWAPVTGMILNVNGVAESWNAGWAPFDYLSGSATYDPPIVAAASVVSTTVPVTGAALGDFVEASFSNALGGLIISAEINTANTATVVFFNPTAAALDVASGTLRVRVRKA